MMSLIITFSTSASASVYYVDRRQGSSEGANAKGMRRRGWLSVHYPTLTGPRRRKRRDRTKAMLELWRKSMFRATVLQRVKCVIHAKCGTILVRSVDLRIYI